MELDSKLKDAAKRTLGFDIVHSHALSFFTDLVQDHGGDSHALVREAGIDPSALDGKIALEYLKFVHLLQRTSDQLGQCDFGLQLAQRQRGGKVIGPIGIVMKNSETIGQALGYCAKHIQAYSLATKVRFKPNRAEHNLLVHIDIFLDRATDVRQAVEHALALAASNIADLSAGQARARKIYFQHKPISSERRYRDFFGCEVKFEQDYNGLLLTEDDLLCPVNEPDEQILEMATDFIEARFPASLPPVHSQVRTLVQRLLDANDCSFEHIAEEMCMHPRTLQRRLRDEGASFENIRDDVRRELAMRLLARSQSSLTEIAHKIGYAETSVLSRSCQRWFGATPEQIRRNALNGAVTPF